MKDSAFDATFRPWNRIRLKYISLIEMGQSPASENYNFDGEGVPFLQGNSEFGRKHPVPILYCQNARKYAQQGEWLFSVRAPVGAVNIADRRYGIGRGLCAIKPLDRNVLLAEYLGYLLEHVKEQLNEIATGSTYTAVSVEDVGSAAIDLPPITKQCAIASLLDRKTAAIDALIEKKQRLVELLEEKRQAVITRAVTKGLDPNVKMKDSGVEWLGEIPAHWIVAPTKLVARLESGHTPSRQHPEYWVNCTVPWFSLSDVWQIRSGRQDYLGETKEMISELGIENSGARLLPAGTVVVSRTASVGFSGIMPCPMATTQDFANWICGPRLQPEYLLYVFRGMKEEFKRLMMGSTHQTIYMPEIETFRTPVPPIVEQKDIVNYVRDRTRLLDEVLDRASSLVERLREYRQALITAAVTGKINVQEEKVV